MNLENFLKAIQNFKIHEIKRGKLHAKKGFSYKKKYFWVKKPFFECEKYPVWLFTLKLASFHYQLLL